MKKNGNRYLFPIKTEKDDQNYGSGSLMGELGTVNP